MDKELIADLILSGNAKVEYPAYDICYHYKDGREEKVKERVTLRQGISVLKKFDRVMCSNRQKVKDILYVFLLPVNEPIIIKNSTTL